MDPVDINALIAQAKRNAEPEAPKAPLTQASTSPEETKEAGDVDELLERAIDSLETEDLKEELDKKAAYEGRRNVMKAKLLAAADVFSGVSQ